MPKINDPKNYELQQQLAKLAGYATYERDLGRDLDAQHRAEKAAKMQAVSDELDDKILQAHQNGATVQSIADALGTKNRNKVYDAMKRASARTTELPDYDPLSDRYSVEDGKIRLTITPDEAKEALGHYSQRYTPGMPLSALFAPLGKTWIFEGDRYLSEFTAEHPVSLWADMNREELVQWAGEHVTTVASEMSAPMGVVTELDDDDYNGEQLV